MVLASCYIEILLKNYITSLSTVQVKVRESKDQDSLPLPEEHPLQPEQPPLHPQPQPDLPALISFIFFLITTAAAAAIKIPMIQSAMFSMPLFHQPDVLIPRR